MKIESIRWEKVEIRYDEPLPGRTGEWAKHETLKDVAVFFNSEVNSLSLRWNVGDKGNDLLLARAKLVSMKPWEMRFEASWWTAKPESKTYDRLIPATIICTL